MAEHYAQLARQRREAGELAASLAAVETGLQVRPQDKTLLALQEEVQQAQAEVERQRAEAERRRRQVAELLRQADKQLTAQQLTEPAGNNAWESYRQVLELAPGNGQAEAGLAEIAARYAQRARQHQEAGELEPSLTAIAKGLQVRPQDKALLALQAEVQAAQTEAKRHRQIAKLLEQAEEQMAAQQLTEPAGDNAWGSYKQILFLDLGNIQAKEGLKRIAEQYAQLARQRQEAGKLEASLAAIAKGLQVRPQDKTLLSIQEEVRQAQAEAERQRRQVEELLRHADEQLAAGQLTEPAGDNAWESYQQVLVLEPENTAAQAGLQRLLGQAKQILNEKIKALNHTEQEVEVEEQAIRLSIQRTLAQEWEQYSKQAASHQ